MKQPQSEDLVSATNGASTNTDSRGTQLTEGNMKFKFIEKIEDHEPDGPVSVTLITLNDGRVVGINDECIVLYPSREAFDDAENIDNPVIPLV